MNINLVDTYNCNLNFIKLRSTLYCLNMATRNCDIKRASFIGVVLILYILDLRLSDITNCYFWLWCNKLFMPFHFYFRTVLKFFMIFTLSGHKTYTVDYCIFFKHWNIFLTLHIINILILKMISFIFFFQF